MRYTQPKITNTYDAAAAIQSDKVSLSQENDTILPSTNAAYSAEE